MHTTAMMAFASRMGLSSIDAISAFNAAMIVNTFAERSVICCIIYAAKSCVIYAPFGVIPFKENCCTIRSQNTTTKNR